MKKTLLFAFVIAILSSCSGGTSSSDSSTKWEYTTTTNEMDDSKVYYAKIEANDGMEFSFPYNGGTKVWLKLRKKGDKTDVMLSITKDKGQFIPSVIDEQKVNVRFDENVAEEYSYSMPADYSVETIFLSNPEKFIEGLKQSKITIMQCSFYNEGTQTIKFNTDSLEWEH